MYVSMVIKGVFPAQIWTHCCRQNGTSCCWSFPRGSLLLDIALENIFNLATHPSALPGEWCAVLNIPYRWPNVPHQTVQTVDKCAFVGPSFFTLREAATKTHRSIMILWKLVRQRYTYTATKLTANLYIAEIITVKNTAIGHTSRTCRVFPGGGVFDFWRVWTWHSIKQRYHVSYMCQIDDDTILLNTSI
jgi:hypothetical protein